MPPPESHAALPPVPSSVEHPELENTFTVTVSLLDDPRKAGVDVDDGDAGNAAAKVGAAGATVSCT